MDAVAAENADVVVLTLPESIPAQRPGSNTQWRVVVEEGERLPADRIPDSSYVPPIYGIAVLPRSSLPPAGSPAVETRPLVEPAVSRALGIYRRRGHKLPRIGQQLPMTVRRTAGVLAVEDQ